MNDKDYHKKYRLLNKAKIKESARIYRAKNKLCIKSMER